MATYVELRTVFEDDSFLRKIDVAVVVAANDLLDGSPDADDINWAAAVFDNPRGESRKAAMGVIASNKALDLSAILAASDPAIQAKVDLVVPHLVTAYAAL